MAKGGGGGASTKMNLDWAKCDPELPQHFNALLRPSTAGQKLSLEKHSHLNKIVKVSCGVDMAFALFYMTK